MVTILRPSPRDKTSPTAKASRQHRGRTSKQPSARRWRHSPPTGPLATRERPVFDEQPDPIVETLPIPAWKRGFDLLWVLLILPVTLVLVPIMFCWIKLTSPGPIIFRQTRIGRGGRPFTMYKFRTMVLDAEAGVHEAHVTNLIRNNQPMTKLDCEDSRLIKGACFIRMSGLDELPQLINVLRGEMSAVGPRPCVPGEFQLYQDDHYRRFAVQPGLTGLWQIKRNHSTTFSEMMAMDAEYVDRLSPWSDFKIIVTTPLALLVQLAGCARSKVWKSIDWVNTERTSA